MSRFLPDFGPADWAIITAIILVPLLMIFGIYAIRSEMRHAGRIKARSIKLKTTREQRLRWRKEEGSRDLLNLLDDVEALFSLIDADEGRAWQEHREAVRLSWMSYRIPVRMALFGSLLLAGVSSAVFMVLAQGPSNPIPWGLVSQAVSAKA
jgi:predicted small integral membrane protein